MNRLGQHSAWHRSLDLVGFDRGRRRRPTSRRLDQRPWCELLEDRRLLTAANRIEDLTGLSISAAKNVPTTQDVATFQSPAAAAATDFTATINWGDGTAATAGAITKDASGVFHVSATHTYTAGGSFTPVVTIEDTDGTTVATGAFYQTNLVSSVAGDAAIQDTNLINPWGLYQSAYTSWAADEGSGLATTYDLGAPQTESTIVTIPSGHPTGVLYNSDPQGFDVAPSTPANLLFATLGGTIAGWASGGSAATLATVAGAEFTGLASGGVTTGTMVLTTTPYLYATDFTGTTGTHGIDVFDSSFNSVTGPGGAFSGKFSDPNLPAGFEPFNILGQLGGPHTLMVAYARPSGTGSLTGAGGYIDEFDTSGNLIKRIVSDSAGTILNGPWGMVTAPPGGFGPFNNDLLVGNFGGGSATTSGGTITAINLTTDTVAGTIDGANGSPLVNPGLWGLLSNFQYVPGPLSHFPLSLDSLYLSAGTDSQTQGLLAQIWFAPAASATVVGLSPANPQPTVSATAGQLFAGPVAYFTDADTSQTASAFDATIDWGDSTSNSPGTIIPLATAGLFEIVGAHIYASAGVYPIGISVEVPGVLSLGINNSASVSAHSHAGLTITGKLNPASDSSLSGSKPITNVVRPDFIGTTSQPDAAISLYATATGTSTPVLIGTGTSGASGGWNITADQALADGSYTITAIATVSGETAGATTTIVRDLVIDTVGPIVTGVSFDRKTRRIEVTFEDLGGLNDTGVGLDKASVVDAANYQLVVAGHPRMRPYRITVASVTPRTTAGIQTVSLRLTGRTKFHGAYSLSIDPARPTDPRGIEDKAGNALDGELTWALPSGNGVPGGDLVARLSGIPLKRAGATRKGT
jgi:uncharacterized protein (TIGR03118 family)